MTEAFAIKGPDDQIHEIKLYGSEGLLREKWALQLARGYKLVTVTVSEKGQPDEDGNNYCRILTILGMEEEGDPVAEVERLKAVSEKGDADELASAAEQILDDMGSDYCVCPAAKEQLRMALDAHLSRKEPK